MFKKIFLKRKRIPDILLTTAFLVNNVFHVVKRDGFVQQCVHELCVKRDGFVQQCVHELVNQSIHPCDNSNWSRNEPSAK